MAAPFSYAAAARQADGREQPPATVRNPNWRVFPAEVKAQEEAAKALAKRKQDAIRQIEHIMRHAPAEVRAKLVRWLQLIRDAPDFRGFDPDDLKDHLFCEVLRSRAHVHCVDRTRPLIGRDRPAIICDTCEQRAVDVAKLIWYALPEDMRPTRNPPLHFHVL